MNRIVALQVALPVAVLSAVVAFWRGERLLDWYPIPLKGVAGRVVIALLFAVLSVVFGLVAHAVYGRAVSSRPDTAAQIYAWVGIGLAVLLSIVGVVVATILKRGPTIAWTLLNLLWGVGYGWWMPTLLGR